MISDRTATNRPWEGNGGPAGQPPAPAWRSPINATVKLTENRVSCFPSTKNKTATMARWRSMRRAHLATLQGPRARRGGAALAAAEKGAGEIRNARKTGLGLELAGFDAKGNLRGGVESFIKLGHARKEGIPTKPGSVAHPGGVWVGDGAKEKGKGRKRR